MAGPAGKKGVKRLTQAQQDRRSDSIEAGREARSSWKAWSPDTGWFGKTAIKPPTGAQRKRSPAPAKIPAPPKPFKPKPTARKAL